MSATAKDRAEEVLHNLQRRAREFLDAEEHLVKQTRNLIEEHGLSTADVRKRLEDLVGKIKAYKIWEKLKSSDAVLALSDYRDGVERYAEESLTRLCKSLPVATKEDLSELNTQLSSIDQKLTDIVKKISAAAPKASQPASQGQASNRAHSGRSTKPNA